MSGRNKKTWCGCGVNYKKPENKERHVKSRQHIKYFNSLSDKSFRITRDTEAVHKMAKTVMCSDLSNVIMKYVGNIDRGVFINYAGERIKGIIHRKVYIWDGQLMIHFRLHNKFIYSYELFIQELSKPFINYTEEDKKIFNASLRKLFIEVLGALKFRHTSSPEELYGKPVYYICKRVSQEVIDKFIRETDDY